MASSDNSAEQAPETVRCPDNQCDLIMKGGLASGVVYGSAVNHLAKSYRFRDIAGTSAGAIAARHPPISVLPA